MILDMPRFGSDPLVFEMPQHDYAADLFSTPHNPDLTYLFNTLSVDNILTLFSLVITERKVRASERPHCAYCGISVFVNSS